MKLEGPSLAEQPSRTSQNRVDPGAAALPLGTPARPDTQNMVAYTSSLEGIQRGSALFQDDKAVERAEKSSLNSRLLELGKELRNVRRINDILEAENADLRERILHQKEAYPQAAEIRGLARRHGSDLAHSVSLLIDENKSLRQKLQSSILSQARLQGKATELGQALREHEERAYAKDLADKRLNQEDNVAASPVMATRTSDFLEEGKHSRSPERLANSTGSNLVNRYCVCSEKLQELLDCIDSQIGNYERGVWQTQVNVLEDERDSLMLKAVVMRQRLAEVQARIVSDPFLAARFGGAGHAPGTLELGRGRNAMTELRETIVQLSTAQEVNAELERRLANERNISRSWQANLRALQRELRDHLADLAVAARASGLRCDMLRGTLAQAGEAAAVKEIRGFTRSEKESLRLLRLARARIAADAQRIEVYSNRVRELEQEVAELRCDMTQLEREHTVDWEDNDDVSHCDNYSFTALPKMKGVQCDIDCTTAALRTARQLLVDRAEAEKAICLLKERKRQLREQREKFIADRKISLSVREDAEALNRKVVAQSVDMSAIAAALFGSQSSAGSSETVIFDALTTDRAREIFRQLMMLREISNHFVSLEDRESIDETKEGPNNETDESRGMRELKKLQTELDKREALLHQAAEAVQAQESPRKLKAEHAKNMQKKEQELEELRQKQARQAREQMANQRKAYEEQLAKERDRCESLRKELELQAKELELQRQLAKESIQKMSEKQYQEFEEELRKFRERQRETESELQRIKAEAEREASAIKSISSQEKAKLAAAAEAAERKAADALVLVKEKEREVKSLELKLKQALAAHPSVVVTPPQSKVVAKKPDGPSSALKKFQAAAHRVAVGQTFTRLARNKRAKKIISGSPSERPSKKEISQTATAEEVSDLSPRSHFKKMVLGKYTSLASAFRHMDVDHSDTIKLKEFANFVDDLGMNIPFSVTHDLYNELASPIDGLIVLRNFYRNLKGETCTLTELHGRLEEIFGDVEQPFNDAGIPPDGRVTKDQFIKISEQAGVSAGCANNLWSDMDRANRGSLQRENVMLLLEDNVDLQEVERVEKGAENLLANVLKVFSGSVKAPKPEAKFSRRSSFRKLTYSAVHKRLGFSPDEAQVDDVLANSPPWDCIYPEDRKAMVADMKTRTVRKDELIQVEEDHNCPLYIVLRGTVNIFQPGFIKYIMLHSLAAPCLLYSEEILQGNPNETCARADSSEDVYLYALDRATFERSYERLLIQRKREVDGYQALLRKVPVVNKLPPPLLRSIAASLRKQTFQPDEEIIARGNDANRVLIVKDGEAVALGLKSSNEEVEVRVYRPLDFFGDSTLVTGRTHTTSVMAKTKCTILSIESDVFYSVLQKLETEFRGRNGRAYTMDNTFMELSSRKSLVATVKHSDDLNYATAEQPKGRQSTPTAVAIPTQEKTFVDSDLIEKLLQEDTKRMREECGLLLETIPVLKDLSKELRQELCNRMTLEIYLPNQAIVLQGEAADKFYIVESGTVSTEVYLGCGKMQKISEMTSGSFFGEMSIIKHEPRTAYNIALTPVYVYALKAADFEELLGDTHEAFLEHAATMYSQKPSKPVTEEKDGTHISEQEIPAVVHLLSGVPVIKLLSLEQLHKLARAFQVMNVREREVVMHEGEPADKFCILLEGMISIQKSPGPGKPRKEVAVVNTGEYLGEIGFLNNQPRTASGVAKSRVKLLYLGRDEFNRYLGHLSEAFLQEAERVYSTQQATDMPAWLLDAKAQGAFYDPDANAKSKEDEDVEPVLTESVKQASEEAEAKAYKKKHKKKSTEGHGENEVTAVVIDTGEDEGKKKKKKKKSGEKEKPKDTDKTPSSSSAAVTDSITPGDLNRLRDLLTCTFKNKFGSLAHAFAAMDINKSDIVDADEFYAFIKKSNIRGFRKPELDALFDELCRPIKGRLIVGNLYRNARGVEPSGAEIHLRAIEIYGSVLAAFNRVANIKASDLCTRENFTSLATNVGVDSDNAESIWTEYVEGVKSTDDCITLSTLTGLMSGKNSCTGASTTCTAGRDFKVNKTAWFICHRRIIIGNVQNDHRIALVA